MATANGRAYGRYNATLRSFAYGRLRSVALRWVSHEELHCFFKKKSSSSSLIESMPVNGACVVLEINKSRYGNLCLCYAAAGMHGAGLTHALFLCSTSALIELFPSYWSNGDHFAAIAGWRGLVYLRWVNNDLTAERPDGRTTVVPPSVVTALVHKAVRRLCPSSSGASLEQEEDSFDVNLNLNPTSVVSAAVVASTRNSLPKR